MQPVVGVPVDPPWNPSWSNVSFTTSEYIYHDDVDNHDDETKATIDRMLMEELWDEQRPIHQHRPEGFMHQWWETLYPRLAFEYCFWHDRGATSPMTGEHMVYTSGLILQFYHNRLNMFSCGYMLPYVRAVRERVMGGFGQPWIDEYDNF